MWMLHVEKASLVCIISSSHILTPAWLQWTFPCKYVLRHIRTRIRTRIEMNVDLIPWWQFRKHQPLAMAQGWWVGYFSPVRLSGYRLAFWSSGFPGIFIRLGDYPHVASGSERCRARSSASWSDCNDRWDWEEAYRAQVNAFWLYCVWQTTKMLHFGKIPKNFG